mgnify:CR=1 FL=1|jgi:hypothetical protein
MPETARRSDARRAETPTEVGTRVATARHVPSVHLHNRGDTWRFRLPAQIRYVNALWQNSRTIGLRSSTLSDRLPKSGKGSLRQLPFPRTTGSSYRPAPESLPLSSRSFHVHLRWRTTVDAQLRDYLNCPARDYLESHRDPLSPFVTPTPGRFCAACPVLRRCIAGIEYASTNRAPAPRKAS